MGKSDKRSEVLEEDNETYIHHLQEKKKHSQRFLQKKKNKHYERKYNDYDEE